MATYLLGTDNGGTVSKAALFTPDGRELAVASQKTETLTPAPDQTEMDMARTWQATAASIREVIDKGGVNPADIACVACTGHGNGLYLVDEAGEPVRNAIASSDSRARGYIDQWAADGVDEAIRPKTMQAIWPAQPNALLAWLRDNEPQSIENARWVFMCKDFIRFRLTGEAWAELTDMSGTSLMNVGTGEYDAEVLEAFGIAEMRDLLPALVRSADICGEITPEAAAETGLAAGTPVAGGMFDIDACGLSVGLTDEGPLCMIAGTWGNNQYISKTPVVDPDVFMTSCYSIPDYYLMLEGSATSASNLEWFVTEFFGAEREAAAAAGGNVFDLVNDLVGATKPEETNIVFLPFLYGSNVNPDAKSSFIGLNNYHGRGHVLRAIYEGVAFGHRFHVDRLLKFRSMPDRIRFTGGAARSKVWVQIFADIFQVPVDIPEGTELGALGAAILGAVASGCYGSFAEAVGAMVKFTRTQEPDPSKKDLYDAKYARHNRVIAALDGVWADLA